RAIGRKDLMSLAANVLGAAYLWDYELARAEELAIEARTLAEESGGGGPGGEGPPHPAPLAGVRAGPGGAGPPAEESIARFSEAGSVLDKARSLNGLAGLTLALGDDEKAERLIREAVRMLQTISDRGYLCESLRVLSDVLVHKGKVEEAERYALLA